DFVHLEVCNVLPVFLRSKCRLLVFDYDGTLTAVTDRHESVSARATRWTSGDSWQLCAPRPELLRALQQLSADPNNHVFIVTGRRTKILEQWFAPLARVGLAAEKGAYIRWPGCTEWETTLSDHDFGWMPTALT